MNFLIFVTQGFPMTEQVMTWAPEVSVKLVLKRQQYGTGSCKSLDPLSQELETVLAYFIPQSLIAKP